MKRCKKCKTPKLLSDFRTHNKGGRRGVCRDCENAAQRAESPWKSDRKRDYQRRRRLTHRGFALTNEAKHRAKEKGFLFDLDWREIQKKVDAGVCEVTGIPFDLATPKSWNAPSLDQIVAGAGYTPDNVRVVLYALNTMANTWGVEMILTIAKAIQEKRTANGERR